MADMCVNKAMNALFKMPAQRKRIYELEKRKEKRKENGEKNIGKKMRKKKMNEIKHYKTKEH